MRSTPHWGLALLVAIGCAGPIPESAIHEDRIEKATQGLEEDPAIEARRSGVEAARAREEGTGPIDEFELRVGARTLESNDLRVLARVPVKRSKEIRAERLVLRADTEIAISKLEETSLERRAELCFPSVDALAYAEREKIFSGYADRQDLLLAMNKEWRSSGMIDELRAARFELESKTHLATWKPAPVQAPNEILGSLPTIGENGSRLVLDPTAIEQTVGRHHPSVGLRRATAERYRAMSQRARARRWVGLRFFDVSYEYTTDNDGSSGVGGRVAFTIPLGGRNSADSNRYQHLAEQEDSKGRVQMSEQMARSIEALAEIQEFEAVADQLRELEALANRAEEIADQWRQDQLAGPPAVSALLDDAFAARNAIVDARERAGIARCTLLAMTGISPDAWPRE